MNGNTRTALQLSKELDIQPYSIAWWTIDGGGVTTSAGSGYSLDGAIGQLDSGLLIGDNSTLAGGFWFRTFTLHTQNLPLILR